MSAFIVSAKHINAIIHAGRATEPGDGPLTWMAGTERHSLTRETSDRVAQMLLSQNVRSVNHRYAEDTVLVQDYKPTSVPPLEAIDQLKLLSSYEYQSCETEDWRETEAHAFCEALRRRLIYQLPNYDEAPWTI